MSITDYTPSEIEIRNLGIGLIDTQYLDLDTREYLVIGDTYHNDETVLEVGQQHTTYWSNYGLMLPRDIKYSMIVNNSGIGINTSRNQLDSNFAFNSKSGIYIENGDIICRGTISANNLRILNDEGIPYNFNDIINSNNFINDFVTAINSNNTIAKFTQGWVANIPGTDINKNNIYTNNYINIGASSIDTVNNLHPINIVSSTVNGTMENIHIAIKNKAMSQPNIYLNSDVPDEKIIINEPSSFKMGIIGNSDLSPAIISTTKGMPLEFHISKPSIEINKLYNPDNSYIIPSLDTPLYSDSIISNYPAMTITNDGSISIGKNKIDIFTSNNININSKLQVSGAALFDKIYIKDYKSSSDLNPNILELDDIYFRKIGLNISTNQIAPGEFADGNYKFKNNLEIDNDLIVNNNLIINKELTIQSNLNANKMTLSNLNIESSDSSKFNCPVEFKKIVTYEDDVTVSGDIFYHGYRLNALNIEKMQNLIDKGDGTFETEFGSNLTQTDIEGNVILYYGINSDSSIRISNSNLAIPGRLGIGVTDIESYNENQLTIKNHDLSKFEISIEDSNSLDETILNKTFMGHITLNKNNNDKSFIINTSQNHTSDIKRNIYFYPGTIIDDITNTNSIAPTFSIHQNNCVAINLDILKTPTYALEVNGDILGNNLYINYNGTQQKTQFFLQSENLSTNNAYFLNNDNINNKYFINYNDNNNINLITKSKGLNISGGINAIVNNFYSDDGFYENNIKLASLRYINANSIDTEPKTSYTNTNIFIGIDDLSSEGKLTYIDPNNTKPIMIRNLSLNNYNDTVIRLYRGKSNRNNNSEFNKANFTGIDFCNWIPITGNKDTEKWFIYRNHNDIIQTDNNYPGVLQFGYTDNEYHPNKAGLEIMYRRNNDTSINTTNPINENDPQNYYFIFNRDKDTTLPNDNNISSQKTVKIYGDIEVTGTVYCTNVMFSDGTIITQGTGTGTGTGTGIGQNRNTNSPIEITQSLHDIELSGNKLSWLYSDKTVIGLYDTKIINFINTNSDDIQENVFKNTIIYNDSTTDSIVSFVKPYNNTNIADFDLKLKHFDATSSFDVNKITFALEPYNDFVPDPLNVQSVYPSILSFRNKLDKKFISFFNNLDDTYINIGSHNHINYYNTSTSNVSLHIQDYSKYLLQLTNDNSAESSRINFHKKSGILNYFWIFEGPTNNNNNFNIQYADNNNSDSFSPNNINTILTLNKNKNIGINESNPLYPLHIKSNDNSSLKLINNYTDDNNTFNNINNLSLIDIYNSNLNIQTQLNINNINNIDFIYTIDIDSTNIPDYTINSNIIFEGFKNSSNYIKNIDFNNQDTINFDILLPNEINAHTISFNNLNSNYFIFDNSVSVNHANPNIIDINNDINFPSYFYSNINNDFSNISFKINKNNIVYEELNSNLPILFNGESIERVFNINNRYEYLNDLNFTSNIINYTYNFNSSDNTHNIHTYYSNIILNNTDFDLNNATELIVFTNSNYIINSNLNIFTSNFLAYDPSISKISDIDVILNFDSIYNTSIYIPTTLFKNNYNTHLIDYYYDDVTSINVINTITSNFLEHNIIGSVNNIHITNDIFDIITYNHNIDNIDYLFNNTPININNRSIDIKFINNYEKYINNINKHYLITNVINDVPHIILENNLTNYNSNYNIGGINKLYSTNDGNFKINYEDTINNIDKTLINLNKNGNIIIDNGSLFVDYIFVDNIFDKNNGNSIILNNSNRLDNIGHINTTSNFNLLSSNINFESSNINFDIIGYNFDSFNIKKTGVYSHDNDAVYSESRMYPPARILSASTTNISGYDYGNGEYIVFESSYGDTHAGWTAFSGTNHPNGYHGTSSAHYDSSTKQYIPESVTPITGLIDLGEWIKIKLPKSINLTSYKIKTTPTYENRAPGKYKIYGSKDDLTWFEVVDNTSISIEYTNYEFTESVSTNSTYHYFALVVTELFGNDTILNLDEFYLYGKEVINYVNNIHNEIINIDFNYDLITPLKSAFTLSTLNNTVYTNIGKDTNAKIGIGKNIENTNYTLDVNGQIKLSANNVYNIEEPHIILDTDVREVITGSKIYNNNLIYSTDGKFKISALNSYTSFEKDLIILDNGNIKSDSINVNDIHTNNIYDINGNSLIPGLANLNNNEFIYNISNLHIRSSNIQFTTSNINIAIEKDKNNYFNINKIRPKEIDNILYDNILFSQYDPIFPYISDQNIIYSSIVQIDNTTYLSSVYYNGDNTISRHVIDAASTTTDSGLSGDTSLTDGDRLTQATYGIISEIVYDNINSLLYIVDKTNTKIRVINYSNNQVYSLSLSDSSTTISLINPNALSLTNDKTTLYLSDSNKLYSINVTSILSDNYINLPTTIISNNDIGYEDGNQSSAKFKNISSINVNNDNTFLYVADNDAYSIRKINISNNEVTTIAGYPPNIIGSRNGMATGDGIDTRFNNIKKIMFTNDNKFLIILDYSNTISRILALHLETNYVSTIYSSETLSFDNILVNNNNIIYVFSILHIYKLEIIDYNLYEKKVIIDLIDNNNVFSITSIPHDAINTPYYSMDNDFIYNFDNEIGYINSMSVKTNKKSTIVKFGSSNEYEKAYIGISTEPVIGIELTVNGFIDASNLNISNCIYSKDIYSKNTYLNYINSYDSYNNDIIFNGNIIPKQNTTLNIGNENYKFGDIYIGNANTINIGTIKLNNDNNYLTLKNNTNDFIGMYTTDIIFKNNTSDNYINLDFADNLFSVKSYNQYNEPLVGFNIDIINGLFTTSNIESTGDIYSLGKIISANAEFIELHTNNMNISNNLINYYGLYSSNIDTEYITINSNLVCSNNSIFINDSFFHNDIICYSNIEIYSNLTVYNNANLSNLYVYSNVFINNNLISANDVDIYSNLFVGKDITADNITINDTINAYNLNIRGNTTTITTSTYTTENLEIISSTPFDDASLKIIHTPDHENNFNMIESSNQYTNDFFIIDANAKIGINKSPSAELDIIGDIHLSGSLNNLTSTILTNLESLDDDISTKFLNSSNYTESVYSNVLDTSNYVNDIYNKIIEINQNDYLSDPKHPIIKEYDNHNNLINNYSILDYQNNNIFYKSTTNDNEFYIVLRNNSDYYQKHYKLSCINNFLADILLVGGGGSGKNIDITNDLDTRIGTKQLLKQLNVANNILYITTAIDFKGEYIFYNVGTSIYYSSIYNLNTPTHLFTINSDYGSFTQLKVSDDFSIIITSNPNTVQIHHLNNFIYSNTLTIGLHSTSSTDPFINSGNINGSANDARFYNPTGIALSHNKEFIIVCDSLNHAIKKIDVNTGFVSLIAGSTDGTSGLNNGIGSDVRFVNPVKVVITSDNNFAYVLEWGNSMNNLIRKINLKNNYVYTFKQLVTIMPTVLSFSLSSNDNEFVFSTVKGTGPLGEEDSKIYKYKFDEDTFTNYHVTKTTNHTIFDVVYTYDNSSIIYLNLQIGTSGYTDIELYKIYNKPVNILNVPAPGGAGSVLFRDDCIIPKGIYDIYIGAGGDNNNKLVGSDTIAFGAVSYGGSNADINYNDLIIPGKYNGYNIDNPYIIKNNSYDNVTFYSSFTHGGTAATSINSNLVYNGYDGFKATFIENEYNTIDIPLYFGGGAASYDIINNNIAYKGLGGGTDSIHIFNDIYTSNIIHASPNSGAGASGGLYRNLALYPKFDNIINTTGEKLFRTAPDSTVMEKYINIDFDLNTQVNIFINNGIGEWCSETISTTLKGSYQLIINNDTNFIQLKYLYDNTIIISSDSLTLYTNSWDSTSGDPHLSNNSYCPIDRILINISYSHALQSDNLDINFTNINGDYLLVNDSSVGGSGIVILKYDISKEPVNIIENRLDKRLRLLEESLLYSRINSYDNIQLKYYKTNQNILYSNIYLDQSYLGIIVDLNISQHNTVINNYKYVWNIRFKTNILQREIVSDTISQTFNYITYSNIINFNDIPFNPNIPDNMYYYIDNINLKIYDNVYSPTNNAYVSTFNYNVNMITPLLYTCFPLSNNMFQSGQLTRINPLYYNSFVSNDNYYEITSNGDEHIISFYYNNDIDTYQLVLPYDVYADILIVGGGGAAGTGIGGGGGAGGVVYIENFQLNANTNYKIKVGNGGINTGIAYNTSHIRGVSGYDSGIYTTTMANINYTANGANFPLIAYGGGGGGAFSDNSDTQIEPSSGGSSGGMGCRNTHDRTMSASVQATQGNTYWNGSTFSPGGYLGGNIGITGYGSAGGGGAGGAGGIGDSDNGGDGGIGIVNDITGTPHGYAGGGGGSTNSSTAANKGIGGYVVIDATTIYLGGDGNSYGTSENLPGGDGMFSTGSGGGGGGLDNADELPGNGGSGIVIIKYTQQNAVFNTLNYHEITSDNNNYKVRWSSANYIDSIVNEPYLVFNNAISIYGEWQKNQYNMGEYSSTTKLNISSTYSNNYIYGDWIIIKLDEKVLLKDIEFLLKDNIELKKWYIGGINDLPDSIINSNNDLISYKFDMLTPSVTEITPSYNNTKIPISNSNNKYNTYAILINKISANSNILKITNIKLYADTYDWEHSLIN